jgi:hypothetical protein
MSTGANPLSPECMTADERLDEVAAILASGVVRLMSAKSSRQSDGEATSPLHFGAEQSVCRVEPKGAI